MARASLGPKPAKAAAATSRPRLFDGADHDRFGLLGAELRRKLVEKQPVEIGAVAEGGVEFAAQAFDAFGLVSHCMDSPMRSLGMAATSALPVADCGAAMMAAAGAGLDDAAGIHDGDAVRRRRATTREIVRDEQIGDAFAAPAGRSSSSRIRPRTETSSADTASSSTISAGRVAMARAMATRCRWPPEISWMRARRQVRGQADAFEQRGDAPRALAAVGDAMDAQRVVEHAGHRGARVEGGERVLEHHLEARPQRRAALRRAAPADRCRRSRMRARQSGSTSRRTMRASVDLPLPDGPTSASVSPRASSQRDVVERGDASGRRGGSVFEMPATSSSGAAHAGAPRCSGGVSRPRWRRADARVGVAAGERRFRRVAPISTSRPWRNTAMRSAMPAASAMSWLMKSSVMPSSRTSCVDQRDDLGLHDGVERAGRLVGDQQLRSGGDRRGDGDALALAAGKLVRIGAHRARDRAGGRGRAVRRPWRRPAGDRGRDGVRTTSAICSPTRQHRIEAGAGILEDEADVAAADRRVAEPRPVDAAR